MTVVSQCRTKKKKKKKAHRSEKFMFFYFSLIIVSYHINFEKSKSTPLRDKRKIDIIDTVKFDKFFSS